VVSSAAAVARTRSARSAGPSTVVTLRYSRSTSTYPPSAATPAVSRPGSRSPVGSAGNGGAGACRGSSSRQAVPCRPPGTANGPGGGSLDGLSSSSSRPDRWTQTPVMSGIGCAAAISPAPSWLSADRSAVAGGSGGSGRGPVPGCGSISGYRAEPSPSYSMDPDPSYSAEPSSSYSAATESGTIPEYDSGPGPGASGYACAAARRRCSAMITGALAGSGILRPRRRACRCRRRIRARATLAPPTRTPAPKTANGGTWFSGPGAGSADATGRAVATGGAGGAAPVAGVTAGTPAAPGAGWLAVAAGCGRWKCGSAESWPGWRLAP